MNKYPYISDKNVYAAVMFACKLIRENGYYNKAIRIASNYYGVDEDEVDRHVRERQAVGRRGKSSANKGKKYKWFVVIGTSRVDGEEHVIREVLTLKGLSESSVKRRFVDEDHKATMYADYGGNYAPYYSHYVLGEFETEEEAKENIQKCVREFREARYEMS